MKLKRTDKAAILQTKETYHLITKFGIGEQEGEIVETLKKALPGMSISAMTREYHIQTQWNNRTLTH